MKLPRVLRAEQIERRTGAPPPHSRRGPHKWLDPEDLEKYRDQEKKGLELYLSKNAEEKIRNHANVMLAKHKEALGLLLGTLHEYEGTEFTMVRDIATTELDSSAVKVRFRRDSYEQLLTSIDDCGFDYIIVGWYHSHPGHGCFMSPTDIRTQKRIFNEKFHSAIVIDPVNRSIKAFYLEGEELKTRPFAVYWDEYQNPYYTRTMKVRRSLSNPDCVPPAEGSLVLPQPLHKDGDQRVEKKKC